MATSVQRIPGVGHLLHTMADCFAVQEEIERLGAGSALIVGAGYIGLEMAEAFRARGMKVAFAEQLPEVLPTVDRELERSFARNSSPMAWRC